MIPEIQIRPGPESHNVLFAQKHPSLGQKIFPDLYSDQYGYFFVIVVREAVKNVLADFFR